MKLTFGHVVILCHAIGLNAYENRPRMSWKVQRRQRYSIPAKPYRNRYVSVKQDYLVSMGLFHVVDVKFSWALCADDDYIYQATELGVRVAQSYMLTARRDLSDWFQWVQAWDGKEPVPEVFGGRCV